MTRLEFRNSFLIITALTLLVYARALLPGQTFIADVLFRFFYPMYHLTRDALVNGSLPLWNPYLSCGVPFLANGQSALFYPGTYLFVLFDFAIGIQTHVILHTILAGQLSAEGSSCGNWLFFRGMGVSPR